MWRGGRLRVRNCVGVSSLDNLEQHDEHGWEHGVREWRVHVFRGVDNLESIGSVFSEDFK